MKTTIISIALFFLAIAAWPQTQTAPKSADEAMKAYNDAEKLYMEAAVEAKRANLRQNKRDIIKKMTTFTADQEKAFWPIYDKHEKQLMQVNDLQYNMIKDYAANSASMTDDKALELASRQWDYQQKRIALRKEYMEDLKKALPGKLVARIMQLENRTDLLIDMEVASNVPLMQ